MKIFKNNLRFRLLSILVVSILIGSLSVGVFLYQHFYNFLYMRFTESMQKYLDYSEHALDINDILSGDQHRLKNYVDRYAGVFNCRVTLVDTGGRVIADSEVPIDQLPKLENHLHRPEIQEALNNPFGKSIRHSATVGQDLLYMARIVDYNNKPIVFLRLAILTEDVNSLLQYTRNYFIFGGILVLIISSVLVGLFSKKITRNLFMIIEKSRKIAQGDLSTRIEIDSKDELSQLSKNMNEMAVKLSDLLNHLKRDKYNLNTVLSSVHDGIIAIDSGKKVIFFNKQALQLLDTSGENIIDQVYYEVIRSQHINSLISSFFEKPVFIRDEIKNDDRALDVVITSFKTEDKTGQGAVMVLRDITQYNRLAKMRREFVANVSHEFKTPLAAIRGYAETLLDWGLDDEKLRKKYIEKIIKQSNQLENLVTDLLELARIEKLQNIEFKPFDPQPVLKEILNEMADAALTKQITLETDLKMDNYAIIGDADMFHSIMINLIDNAIKYTPVGGKITVESKSMQNQVVFTVSDNGIGIPEKDQSRVFERFYRVDKARSRSIGGTRSLAYLNNESAIFLFPAESSSAAKL